MLVEKILPIHITTGSPQHNDNEHGEDGDNEDDVGDDDEDEDGDEEDDISQGFADHYC